MNNYGNKTNINTEKLRTAIWKFSEAILGYTDDYYDFEKLKQIMEDHQYHIQVIKKVIFNPNHLENNNIFASVDFCHIVLLSANAKFYVAVNAITKAMDCV